MLRHLELDELTLNKAKVAAGDLRFKVWPSRRDRSAFKAVIDPAETSPDGKVGVAGAFQFFFDAMSEWLLDEEPSAEAKQGRLETLQSCLDSLLFVVSINLDETDNAQVIFETLNARGMPLNALDLSKNALFISAEREGADLELLHDEHWEPTFEEPGDTYWQDEERQGRLKRPRADLFLMHWLTMELGEVVPATRLFDEFRVEILRAQPAPRMRELVPRLCADATLMRSFESFPPGSVEALFFERLTAMDTTTLYPLALLLFRQPEISEQRRLRALAALESWLVRRTILRYTAKNYNRILASLLKAVKENLSLADDVVIRELRASDAITTVWPADSEVRTRLQYENLYAYIPQARVRMLLEACERDLRDPAKTENIDLPAGLSLEHILPQS